MGMALIFQFGLINGGPASLLYGTIVSGFGSTAVAFSLAEMASMYVTHPCVQLLPNQSILIGTRPSVLSTVGQLNSHQLLLNSGV